MSKLDDTTLNQLQASVRGKIITPAESDYDESRQIWNGMIDRRPAAIVRCIGTADVVACVNFAREQEIPFSIRGGGHNIAGLCVADDALMIDLSQMQSVAVDVEARTARVSGGALLGHLDGATLQHNLVTTAGVVSHTGVGGFTLGGGMGRTDRLHGL